nr:RNA-binding S4 domain-containing protein [Tanacetum cinerariifolium]
MAKRASSRYEVHTDFITPPVLERDFGFQPSSRDFLASILGTGIAREEVGDILLLVGNVAVTCKKMPLISLRV